MSEIDARRLAELAREERRRQGGAHPSAERLTAYRTGELAPADADQIQEHLAVCRRCAQRALDLPRFHEILETDDLEALKGEGELPTEEETAASWQALRARLAPAFNASSAPKAMVPAKGRLHRLTRSPATVYALAAGLAACLVGFPLWIASHPKPEVASPVVFYPVGGTEVLRSGGASQPITVHLADAAAVLALPISNEAQYPSYRIEVLGPSGEVRLSAGVSPIPIASPATEGPAGSPPRILPLELTRGQLAPGDYRLRILGLRGSRGEVIAEHLLRVSSP